MSNLIALQNDSANIVQDEWTLINLPAAQVEVRKQAGKIVLFKLTGEQSVTEEQIKNTVIPEKGKIIVPLRVFIARNQELAQKLAEGEVGVWLATHELLEDLTTNIADINSLPIIAIFVERFADGRIFSLGTLLRKRYHFKNELRAFGDVLRDQLFFLKRSGFNSFLIRHDRSALDAIAGLKDFSTPYQGAIDDPRPAFKRYNRGT
ncbi:MAG: hypothetical protein CVU29_06070 [Betaproteobacteria bacterium HGW-Betaproteobacteria-22]|nr:MAG: hypothetical protein CVU29_06070 [Betaproteobacteria bacterium HGW-Betaproteobacteria-22]